MLHNLTVLIAESLESPPSYRVVFSNECEAHKMPTDVFSKKLISMHERKTAHNKACLIRRLANLKYRDGKNVTKHRSDLQS